jgi:hypothetical protein
VFGFHETPQFAAFKHTLISIRMNKMCACMHGCTADRVQCAPTIHGASVTSTSIHHVPIEAHSSLLEVSCQRSEIAKKPNTSSRSTTSGCEQVEGQAFDQELQQRKKLEVQKTRQELEARKLEEQLRKEEEEELAQLECGPCSISSLLLSGLNSHCARPSCTAKAAQVGLQNIEH